MPMRPVPPHTAGPSPRIATFETATQRVQPGLERPPKVGPTLPCPEPFVPTSPTCSPAFHPLYPDTPQLQLYLQLQQQRGLVERSRSTLPRYGIVCGGCTDRRSNPRSARRGRPDPGDGYTRPGEPSRRGDLLRNVEDGHHSFGSFGSRLPEVHDRVPFLHAAFADDPAFHRPDQEVVADDNTEENHRRRLPPHSNNFSDNGRVESRHDVRILPEITETQTTAANTDTNAGRVPGGSHRQRYKINIDTVSLSGKEHAAEEKEEEEEEALEPLRGSSPESESGLGQVRELVSDEKEPEIGASGEHGGVYVTQVPQVTRPERWRGFRKRQTRGLLFVLYLLALPILCATNGSPPGDRGSFSLAHNTRNSSPEPEGRHPYRDYSWEVNQINPWLSACDLAGPAPADLQGSCGPPETPKNCPDACRGSADSFFAVVSQAREYRGVGGIPRAETGERAAPEQCLFYLEESHKTDICQDDFGKDSSERFQTVRENRYRFLSGLRLRHCCEHAALNALASGHGGPLEEVLGGNDGCRKAIGKLLAVDALAARLHCEFGEVLARYDCGQPYSVIYNCSHCKEAYRRWVCSSLVPYFAHDDQPRQKNQELADPWMGTGMRIRPCRSFCQTVEQRCPYLLPGDRAPAYPTQYAGEPTFLCRDPNIPETGQQASRALHADEECCFHVCSDDDPGLGVCENCTEPQIEIGIRGGSVHRDPPTAPQCELNSASYTSGHHQSTTSGTWSGTSSTTEPGASLVHHPGSREGVETLDVSGGTGHHQSSSGSGTSFCGSGGVGSMSSGASSPRVTPLSMKMCAFCAWGALIGVCTIKVATSWTTSKSSLQFPWRPACTKFIRGVNSRLRRRPSRPLRRSPPAKTIYPVILSCSIIRSFLLGVYELVLTELSSAWYELFEVKLKKRRYNNYITDMDLIPLDEYIEDRDRRTTVNSTRLRRRRRRGTKRRRKKKRRRAS